MVIWLTGLAASGKTTIGRFICEIWKQSEPATVLVDGDDVRRILQRSSGPAAYTMEERRAVADRIAALCAWLDKQGVNVVCCTISLFSELHAENRRNFGRYFEVFINTPMEVIKKRDQKGIYSAAARGELHNVIGVDLPFDAPRNPDYIFDNSPERTDMTPVAAEILARALAS